MSRLRWHVAVSVVLMLGIALLDHFTPGRFSLPAIATLVGMVFAANLLGVSEGESHDRRTATDDSRSEVQE